MSENTEGAHIEIYNKNMLQVANPSQWVTEIYVPIKLKTVVAPKPIQPTQTPVNQTTTTSTSNAVENKTP